VLTAAVLHDTVEDTTTDYDDIEEKWGAEIGGWVTALSKDKRLPYEEREKTYCRVLTESSWQVQVCKLADLFDNILDTAYLPEKRQLTALRKKKRYLDALRSGLKPEAASAFETVTRLYEQTEAALMR
jgi:guanosine-3',5'-bis(diphosphate) 3'-pyrophosphohydrolase